MITGIFLVKGLNFNFSSILYPDRSGITQSSNIIVGSSLIATQIPSRPLIVSKMEYLLSPIVFRTN
jgi:hypothetical protein